MGSADEHRLAQQSFCNSAQRAQASRHRYCCHDKHVCADGDQIDVGEVLQEQYLAGSFSCRWRSVEQSALTINETTEHSVRHLALRIDTASNTRNMIRATTRLGCIALKATSLRAPARAGLLCSVAATLMTTRAFAAVVDPKDHFDVSTVRCVLSPLGGKWITSGNIAVVWSCNRLEKASQPSARTPSGPSSLWSLLSFGDLAVHCAGSYI